MDRVNFIESVSGIEYPEMIVNFFDQFIALKQFVENNSAKINVISSTKSSISFAIEFLSSTDMNNMYQAINSLGSTIIVYQRSISILLDIINEKTIKITLQ